MSSSDKSSKQHHFSATATWKYIISLCPVSRGRSVNHMTTYHFPRHWQLWPDCSEDPAPGNSLWRWPSPGAAPPPCCQWCGNTWLQCLWNRRDSILSVKLSHPWQDETRWRSPHRRSPSPRRSFRHSTSLRTASMLSTTKTTKWGNYHEACLTLVLPRSLP